MHFETAIGGCTLSLARRFFPSPMTAMRLVWGPRSLVAVVAYVTGLEPLRSLQPVDTYLPTVVLL